MERIEIGNDICNGKPVIRGTRITVETVLGYLAAGDSVEAILAVYPTLKREDVLACLTYARNVSHTHSTVLAVA